MKDNKNTRLMQEPSDPKLHPNAVDATSRVYARVLTHRVTDDPYAAALLEVLYDQGSALPEEQMGDWVPYNVREIRHATNLTAAEQRHARLVLATQGLVAFHPSFAAPQSSLVDLAEFCKRIGEELEKEGVIVPEELRYEQQ